MGAVQYDDKLRKVHLPIDGSEFEVLIFGPHLSRHGVDLAQELSQQNVSVYANFGGCSAVASSTDMMMRKRSFCQIGADALFSLASQLSMAHFIGAKSAGQREERALEQIGFKRGNRHMF